MLKIFALLAYCIKQQITVSMNLFWIDSHTNLKKNMIESFRVYNNFTISNKV